MCDICADKTNYDSVHWAQNPRVCHDIVETGAYVLATNLKLFAASYLIVTQVVRLVGIFNRLVAVSSE